MTLLVFFQPAARQEVTEAFEWYEREAAGLGAHVLACFHSSRDPKIWQGRVHS